jgi:hypothetical protein
MSKPQSLGDVDQKSLRLVKNVLDMPKAGRPALVHAFEEIIGMGRVQKVVVEVGCPITFWRLVEKDEGAVGFPEIPEEVVNEDLYAAVRSAKIEEFPVEKAESIYFYLMSVFSYLSDRDLVVKSFLVADAAKFCGMVNSPTRSDLFGIPIAVHGDVPEDVLLVAATERENTDQITLSLRLELISKEKS